MQHEHYLKEKKIIYADTFLKRVFGLMFKKDFEGILLFSFKKPSIVLIHSFFMRFSIDVMCFNDNGNLIKSFTLNPWRVKIVKGVKYIVERKSKK